MYDKLLTHKQVKDPEMTVISSYISPLGLSCVKGGHFRNTWLINSQNSDEIPKLNVIGNRILKHMIIVILNRTSEEPIQQQLKCTPICKALGSNAQIH